MYRLTAMLRETVEEANKIIHSVVYKQKGKKKWMLIFKIKVRSQKWVLCIHYKSPGKNVKDSTRYDDSWESGASVPELKASALLSFCVSPSPRRDLCQLGRVFIESGIYIWEAVSQHTNDIRRIDLGKGGCPRGSRCWSTVGSSLQQAFGGL